MTRTELLALAERIEPMAAAPIFDGLDISAAADFLRQIAQAQPVAVRHNFDGDGWLYIDGGSGSDWLTRYGDAEALYTLPLED